MSDAFVLRLGDSAADLATAGGKGASLARLAASGLPVPPGFHVTTRAYRDFVSSDGLATRISAALQGVDLADNVAVGKAAETIAAAFAAREVPSGIASAIHAAYTGGPVAVRSSATAEDLPDMSFAGQHDTFLNITGIDALLDAVKRCWSSLWTARAIAYRAHNGVDATDVALAVVVQELVQASAAGVLFTANPLTGSRDEVVVNAAWGLGEALVGGQVTPDAYVVAGGREMSRSINAKTVMTVRAPSGTREEPVPDELRHRAVLDPAQVVALAALGKRIETLYGTPVDVEWAVHDGQFQILQARPITNLPVPQEVWNATLAGDYLWTSGNVSEAVPGVMTPVTWSVIQALAMPAIGGHPTSGNIGGRFYLNLSATMAMGTAVGMGRAVRQVSEQTFGRITVEVPPLPMSRLAVLRAALPIAVLFVKQGRAYRKNLTGLLAGTPDLCRSLHARISAAAAPAALLDLWRSDVDDLLHVVCQTLDVGARQVGGARFASKLRALVGEADAATLLTGLHSDAGDLASLGPLMGLSQLRDGEIDRETYALRWGHRCPDEFELSAPRPAEDPAWIDQQRDGFVGSPGALLERQAAARDEAWQRLRRRHPGRARGIRRALDRAAASARARERARSEMVRTFWVLRAFVLQAGVLTAHGEDMFFLTLDEILAVLAGSTEPLAGVPARRAAYAHYKSLPPYPALIRGRFDPEAWAADPGRRSDHYDATAPHEPMSSEIKGFPGAGGVVTGPARVVSTVEEAQTLREGEILVAVVTNVGWTPLFPRAAAVVTDVGAPLSHAAIVARELGIPAVVGCGNATTRLRTGDRVRVDGANGTVTVLS
jgi:phosphohistidine swiveling domain-containing protein